MGENSCEVEMPLLFSYGTLQLPEVQKATFGCEVAGRRDALVGYRQTLLEITDEAVLAASGQRFHPIFAPTGDVADRIEGIVFDISDADLAAADAYEVADYKRVEAPLASGAAAWVYVKARRISQRRDSFRMRSPRRASGEQTPGRANP